MKTYKSSYREHDPVETFGVIGSEVEFLTDGISWFIRHTWHYDSGATVTDMPIRTLPRTQSYLNKHRYGRVKDAR